MTNENETRQDELAVRRGLDGETRSALDEVIRHSLGRIGKTAHAIEAGLAALRDDAVLAPGHREALEEFAWRVSESTPSVDGSGGIGMRCVRWRDAVRALLDVLRPDPLQGLCEKLAAAMTPQQAEQLARPLSEQQRDLFQQALGAYHKHVSERGVSSLSPWATTVIRSATLDASELSLATVRDCTRASVRSGSGVLIFPTWSVEVDNHFTWRGLTGLQLGILEVWAEAHRGSTVEGGPIPTTNGVIASAIDVTLRVLDDPELDLSCLSDYRAVLVEYAAIGPQESVRDAVRALLAAVDTRSKDAINSSTTRET